MNPSELEEAMRAREQFQDLKVHPDLWTIVRLDGRGFSALTEQHFDKPFDPDFKNFMELAAHAVMTEFGGHFAYIQSDEISVLLPPGWDMFGRRVEKLLSVSAGLASATFTYALGAQPAHFDSRVWVGAGPEEVADYFEWRQSDAMRNGLNSLAYWTLRKAGKSASQATSALKRAGTIEKVVILTNHGVRIQDSPEWAHNGIGLQWETFTRPGYDPIREVVVAADRRRIIFDRFLPRRKGFREMVLNICEGK